MRLKKQIHRTTIIASCLTAMLSASIRPAFAQVPGAPKSKVEQKIEKGTADIAKAKDDPWAFLNSIIPSITWILTGYTWKTGSDARKKWVELRKNYLSALGKIKKQNKSRAEVKSQQPQVDVSLKGLTDTINGIDKALETYNQAIQERKRVVKKIADTLGEKRLNHLDTFAHWMSTEDGIVAQDIEQLKPLFAEYRKTKTDQKSAKESMTAQFDEIVYNSMGTQELIENLHTKLQAQSDVPLEKASLAKPFMFFNQRAVHPNRPWEFLTPANRMSAVCETAAANLVEDTKDDRVNKLKARAKLREDRNSLSPVRTAVRSKYTILAALGAGAGWAHAAYKVWHAPKPIAVIAPPPPLKDELVSPVGMRAIEPFVAIVEEQLRVHRKEIFRSIKEKLSTEEKEALMAAERRALENPKTREELQKSTLNKLSPEDVKHLQEGDLILEQKLNVLLGKTNQDITDIRNAINKSLQEVGPEQIAKTDTFVGILRRLNLSDFNKLSAEEQASRRRSLNSFLYPFYTHTLNVSLKGITKEPAEASNRVKMELVEQMVADTIDRLIITLGTVNEPVRPVVPAPGIAAPAVAPSLKASPAASADGIRPDSEIVPEPGSKATTNQPKAVPNAASSGVNVGMPESAIKGGSHSATNTNAIGLVSSVMTQVIPSGKGEK